MTKTLAITANTTPGQIEAFVGRLCGECGQRADKHIHLFGSDVYLCPTVKQFTEVPDDAPAR